MSADIIAALVAFVKADASTAALVGSRVYGVELPKDEADARARKIIVLKPSGEATLIGSLGGGSYVEHTTQRFDVFSYGETPVEVEKVRGAVNLALKRLRRTVSLSVLIHWCNSAGGFTSRRDPDIFWPFNFQSYQTLFAENNVT